MMEKMKDKEREKRRKRQKKRDAERQKQTEERADWQTERAGSRLTLHLSSITLKLLTHDRHSGAANTFVACTKRTHETHGLTLSDTLDTPCLGGRRAVREKAKGRIRRAGSGRVVEDGGRIDGCMWEGAGRAQNGWRRMWERRTNHKNTSVACTGEATRDSRTSFTWYCVDRTKRNGDTKEKKWSCREISRSGGTERSGYKWGYKRLYYEKSRKEGERDALKKREKNNMRKRKNMRFRTE